ncbi:DUF5954 family protein [Nocardiopsis sp. NPDC007018]|uniref:DUF5954 family protein n=1 Tax=Nocardiopsis sp. NPDC007018 TaxID=3155721 RepID=UPI0033E09816
MDPSQAPKPAPLRVTYPLYQPVMEVDGTWLTLRSPSNSPQGGRDELVNHFCCRAREREGDPRLAHEYREFHDAEVLLSWERHDEVRVLGTRYRVARIERFLRFVDGLPEAPRPCDPVDHPTESVAGEEDGYWSGMDLTRDWEEDALAQQARGEILRGSLPRHFPEDVRMDGAIRSCAYPDVAILNPDFQWLVHDAVRRTWGPYGPEFSDPADARSYWLTHFDARSRPSVYTEMDGIGEEETEAIGRAVATQRVEGGDGPIRVLNRSFHLARTVRAARSGFDGPEPPRESDPEFHEPVAVSHKEHADTNGLEWDEAPVPPPVTEAHRRFLPGHDGRVG